MNILKLKGGFTAICSDLSGIKLLVHVISKSQDADEMELVGLIKSCSALINMLDHVYLKLLGSDYDCQLTALLSEIYSFSQEQDEKSQKGAALNLIFKNDFFQEALYYMYNAKDVRELLDKEVEITLLS